MGETPDRAEIGEFLKLITGVAEQTKLLALNATIEALEQGSRWGRRSATAGPGPTSDIESRIAAIQRAAAAGVQALSEIETQIGEIEHAQGSVASAIEASRPPKRAPTPDQRRPPPGWTTSPAWRPTCIG
ncbi:MAG: hypothetical protein IPK24_18535 [Kineosporiaceae bacterium]|nr:hypothetical protein [Kineosporiaceae bacterium]